MLYSLYSVQNTQSTVNCQLPGNITLLSYSLPCPATCHEFMTLLNC